MYEHLEGAPMGNPVFAVIANLCMESFEQQAITSSSYKPRVWKRYTLTSLASYSIWTISSLPSASRRRQRKATDKLTFFDTAIAREPDGQLTTGVYRTPTRTEQYLARYEFNKPLDHIAWWRLTSSMRQPERRDLPHK